MQSNPLKIRESISYNCAWLVSSEAYRTTIRRNYSAPLLLRGYNSKTLSMRKITDTTNF